MVGRTDIHVPIRLFHLQGDLPQFVTEWAAIMGQGLSAAEKTAIRETWVIIKPNAHMLGTTSFVQLFRKYPHYKAMFPRIKGVPDGELERNKSVSCHGLMFSRYLTALVRHLDDDQMTDELVHRLAHRHSRLKIGAPELQHATDEFCEVVGDKGTLKSGFDKMNPLIEEYMGTLRKESDKRRRSARKK